MSCDMTKPTKWLCAQWRLRSAWASVQSDQSALWSHWVAMDPRFLHADSEDTHQTDGCPGWSESSLGAHSFCWFCHVVAHIMKGSALDRLHAWSHWSAQSWLATLLPSLIASSGPFYSLRPQKVWITIWDKSYDWCCNMNFALIQTEFYLV